MPDGTMPAPIWPLSGRGRWLYDASGRRYLDFRRALLFVPGHAHPHLVEALQKQAAKPGTPPPPHSGRRALMARFGRAPFADRVLFATGGRGFEAAARSCASISMIKGSLSATGSSPATVPSMGARWRPSPHRATRSIWRLCAQCTGLTRSHWQYQRIAQCDHRRDGCDPGGAHPGRAAFGQHAWNSCASEADLR